MREKNLKICLKGVYELAENTARERQSQKENYKSCLKLSDNYELVGVLGELLVSLVIGEKMDLRLLRDGDDGYDFKNINIKTSEEHKARHLIEFTDKKFIGYYIFVIINLEKKYGYVKGYIHSSEFVKKAKITNFGYGDRLAIELDLLKPWYPKKPIELNNIYK